MRRRWFALAGIAFAGALFAATQPLRAVGPFSFPHRPHISDAVVEAGLRSAADALAGRAGSPVSDAECRVCHDFAKGAEAHLSGCDPCHVGGKYLQKDVGAATPAGGRRPFPHAEHLKKGDLTCFSCHRMQVEEDWVEFSVPPPSLGPRGVGGRPGGPLGESTCADCHAEHEPQGGKVKQDERTGDGRACATCHLGTTSIVPLAYRPARPAAGTVRPFRHADHGGSAGRCEDCHAELRTSRTIWDYDPSASTAARCVACHVKDARGTPLVGRADPPRTSSVPFVAFSRFPHDAHLAKPKGEIQTSGQVTAECRTCHYPETDAAAKALFPGRAASAEPVGRAELVDYRTCEPCHKAWKVENHGTGEWACFKCHSGAPDAQGKLPVAEAIVTRQDIERVAFAKHHHPGITREGGALADPTEPDGRSCRDCHRADEAELRSRLAGKVFAHAPHVSATPRNAECLQCHPTAATTSWSEDLARFEARVGGAGSTTGAAALAKGCLDCHVGATSEELGLAEKRRIVPQFDHKAHVSTDAFHPGVSGIQCVECHVPGGEAGYQIPPDVAGCTKCHSHDPAAGAAYARTGPKSSTGETQACKFCHEELFPSGRGPERVARQRTHLDLLPGKQWHDLGGDCAACHERDGLDGRRSDYRERITTARVRGSIHDDPALAGQWFNDPRIAQKGADAQGRTCMTCHRREPRGYLRSLTR